MEYVLGIDGGNSKTLAAVADRNGRVLGVGRSGGSNHQGIGVPGAVRQIQIAAEGALSAANLRDARPAVAFCALAGADLPEDFDLLLPALRALHLAQHTELNNDTIAGLRAGSDSRDAVVVVWGAGTNAAGRNARGQEIRLPGLGWQSGDWGGGGDLALEAVRLAVRARDGRGRATVLEREVPRVMGARDVDDLVRMLYTQNGREADSEIRQRFLSLAPLVLDLAAAGDEVAGELVERAAQETVCTALALLRRLNILAVPADVVLSGSVFKQNGELLVQRVRAMLEEEAPRARVFHPEVEPVLGAVFCALEALGVTVDPAVRSRARDSYGRWGSVQSTPQLST